jgi:hypothetical protein
VITKESIKPTGIKKYPYFRKGVLAFEKSGHTLTRDRAYYVCSKKQKRQCVEPEVRTIKAEDLERRFSYLTKTFMIPEKAKERVIKEMFRGIFSAFVDNLLDSHDFYELIGLTTDALKTEVKAGDTTNFKGDAKTIKAQMEKIAEKNTRLITAITLATVIILAKPKPKRDEIGKVIAYLSEKVYLSNDGKITKIVLCPLGDYIFQFLRKQMPEYTKPFKWFAFTRMPDPPPFRKVLDTITTEGLGEMVPPVVASTDVITGMFQVISKMFTMSPEQATNALIYMDNSPAFWAGAGFIVPKRKRKNKIDENPS